jgi:hypothetical protein
MSHQRETTLDIDTNHPQFPTPKRARLMATIDVVRNLDLVHRDGRPVFNSELFEYNGYSSRRGWEMI